MEMEVAVLNQKIEFLNEELEESRQKEKNVQQSYDNLLKTIQEGNRVPSADEIYSQIQEMHTDYAEKISSLKASYFQEKSEQDHEYRCLELELKKSHTDHEETKQKLERAQQRVSFANGFEENRMAELENKLIEAQVALQWQKENTKNKIERKIAGYKKQVEISREEGRKEVLQVQTDADKTLKEMRQIYQIEKQNFDEKLDDIQKAYDETQYQKLQIEEAIMSRPSITDGRTSLARKSEIIDIIEFHLSRVQNEAENQILGSTMSCARCAHSAQKVAKLTEIITESRDNIEDLYLEKQQVEINLEAAVLQIRKLKLQVDQKNEEMITREVAWKNHVIQAQYKPPRQYKPQVLDMRSLVRKTPPRTDM